MKFESWRIRNSVKSQSRYLLFFFLLLAFPTIQILSMAPPTALAAEKKPRPTSQSDEDKLFPYSIPADLPVPEKSERVHRSFQSKTLTYTFGCRVGSFEVISFYRDQLPKRGWKTTVTFASENKAGPLQNLSGKKEEDGRQKSCEIRIAPIGPGVTVMGSSGEGTVSNPPFMSYVIIRYTDPALVPKPVN